MILYEWTGKDGRSYRMAVGDDAIHPFVPGQQYELQVLYGTWWAMKDWNVERIARAIRRAIRGPR